MSIVDIKPEDCPAELRARIEKYAKSKNLHPSNQKGQKQMTMTKEELAAKLEAHAKWLKTRFTDHVEGERADLTGADLTGADLTGANLTGANLTFANLTGANLKYADLTGVNLTDADLTDSDLTGADLTGAKLEHVYKASTLVWDAISATISARIALKKTRIEWEHHE